MSRFEEYFLMEPSDVGEYVAEKLSYFPADAKLTCQEIGDGNLNYVFRLQDEKTGKSIIAKQAGVNWRINDEVFLSTDRGRIEADILKLQAKAAPGLVPEVYLYDPVMCVILMEDMIGHTMMRTALLRHEIFPGFSEDVSEFLAQTLLSTCDAVMDPKEKKKLVQNFINPDLCEITEDLVYTEPYLDNKKRNELFPPNQNFIQREIYGDPALRLEVAKLKYSFMTHAQALIHGDLHTGSIFINQKHTFFFDPEFAFFGPMGYDVGNIIANLFFAWCHGNATIEDPAQRAKFCGWCFQTIEETVDKFIAKFRRLFREKVTDPMAKTEGFLDWYLAGILEDTAATAGVETIRRIVGIAKVKDLTTIPDDESRLRAERCALMLAKQYIMNRGQFKCGGDYRRAMETMTQIFRKPEKPAEKPAENITEVPIEEKEEE